MSLDLTLGVNVMGGECACVNQMVLWLVICHLKIIEVLKCGDLVVTDVVQIVGGVDKKKKVLVLFSI